MIQSFAKLFQLLEQKKIDGCFMDTSILFAATYPMDHFNEASEKVFNALAATDVPAFSNVTVRAEFLENHRRVLIAECLIDLLEDFEDTLDGPILEKLKSHRTIYRRKMKEERSFKIDINQIKEFRRLLSLYDFPSGNGWEIFCKSYLSGKLAALWADTQSIFELHFISLHSSESSLHLNEPPQWESVVKLMEFYGVGSSDAMILNMFLCSKISTLVTADLEMAFCALKESKGSKLIFVPDSLCV